MSHPNFKITLLELAGSLIKLEKRGNSHIGLCPFHDDHNPSMHIGVPVAWEGDSRKRIQIFKCYVCGMGGDILRFVKEYYRCKTYKRAKNIIRNFEIRPFNEERKRRVPKPVDLTPLGDPIHDDLPF